MIGSMLPILHTFAAVTCDKVKFLGLVPWYQYLHVVPDGEGGCKFTDFDPSSGSQIGVLGIHSPFLRIGLAILDDLMRIAAMVAVGFVIYGGIQYVTSQGAPDATKKAQQTIINALIGVAIAILAASIVAFIGTKLGSP